MSIFAKRHYEAIATVMQEAKPKPNWDANKHTQWDVTVNRLANVFARDNDMFKRDRFIAACEPAAPAALGANVRARS